MSDVCPKINFKSYVTISLPTMIRLELFQENSVHRKTKDSLQHRYEIKYYLYVVKG